MYEVASAERKAAQDAGTCPLWMNTNSYIMFKAKYLHGVATVNDQLTRIAETAAQHAPKKHRETALNKFKWLLLDGILSTSTPIRANMGTDRGLPVACSGNYIGDSILDFYKSGLETAVLTKHGFGTSSYIGDIRPRGSSVSVGGKASGVLPVFKQHVAIMRDVSQGSTRRGSWAGYIDIDSGDIDEILDYVLNNPEDANIGINITDAFIEKLDNKDKEATELYQKIIKLRLVAGRGYLFKIDEANRQRPRQYIKHNLDIKASNLCSEIVLHSDEDHTFSCVLSSMNLAMYDDWKDTDAIFWATVFLDCVVSDFLKRAKHIEGLEKVVRFTEKGRAIGLGVMGLHTLFQQRSLPFESLEAHLLNTEIFQKLAKESTEASQWMAHHLGEPVWCKGFGQRNTHRLAIAPTKSSAVLQNGVSEGINPDPAFIFNQTTSVGDISRINPLILEIMQDKGVYTDATLNDIIKHFGSVQHVDWLDDDQKKVFKTAFEIDQMTVVRMAEVRQRYICQAQSLNLFFSADEKPEVISAVHKHALKGSLISLYYVTTKTGINASSGESCEACE